MPNSRSKHPLCNEPRLSGARIRKQCKHRVLQVPFPFITPYDIKGCIAAYQRLFFPSSRSNYSKPTKKDTMSAPRLMGRFLRPLPATSASLSGLNRSFGTTALRFKDSNERAHPNVSEHRDNQTTKGPNQAVPNTTTTMTKDYPKVGERTAPPDMLNSVDPNYRPADPYPGKVEHFTGGRQETGAQKPELGVGEMEGITFKVEPLKRVGEDTATMRARLLCMLLLGISLALQKLNAMLLQLVKLMR